MVGWIRSDGQDLHLLWHLCSWFLGGDSAGSVLSPWTNGWKPGMELKRWDGGTDFLFDPLSK